MGLVHGARSFRQELKVRRVRDNQLLARGIANWVYLDAVEGLPTRVHPAIAARFERHDPPVLPPLGKVLLTSETPALFEHTMTRRAQFYEADSAQHTNNAVYVDWMEEAVRAALWAMGYHLVLDGSAPLPWFYRHELEYLRSAMPRDEIKVIARLMRCGNTRGEWQVEIRHAVSREQLLRARTTMVWVDAVNRSVPWSRAARDSV